MTDVVVWLVLALVAGALGAEVVAWCRPLQRALIRRAAAVLPKEDAERYVEEWYRELEELPDGPVTRLLWVTFLVLRRASLARALGVPRTVVGFTGGLKRLMDISVVAISIVVVAPVLVTIAAAIKIQDGGPMIFRQTRVGRDGSTFSMLKFRSMHVDIEQRLAEVRAQHPHTGLLFMPENDPRVTRLGRFLRRFSLDELPQLFNVLGGSMSLVGPRPPLQREFVPYEDHAPRRLLVTPGLTGLWQLSGRSLLSWEEGVRLDLRYVENWTLTLDLLIMWKTFFTVMSRRGTF